MHISSGKRHQSDRGMRVLRCVVKIRTYKGREGQTNFVSPPKTRLHSVRVQQQQERRSSTLVLAPDNGRSKHPRIYPPRICIIALLSLAGEFTPECMSIRRGKFPLPSSTYRKRLLVYALCLLCSTRKIVDSSMRDSCMPVMRRHDVH